MNFKKIFILLFFWLGLGFTIGTLILLGPLRWMVNLLRRQSISETYENLAVMFLIFFLIIISFYFAIYFRKMLKGAKSIWKKIALLLIPILGTISCLYILLSPELINHERDIDEDEDEINESFTIGTYPTQEKIELLKLQNFNSVICLLSPLVTPFEPILIEKERDLLKKANIQLIELPMLPWISSNAESLRLLDSICKNPTGKYYVHCYLGKDRVNAAKKIIKASGMEIEEEISNSHRDLDDIELFERGPVVKIDDDLYFTAFPTDDEMMGYFVAGNTAQVVCFLDPKEEGASMFIEKEKEIMKTFHIPLVLIPIPNDISDRELFNRLKSIKLLKGVNIFHEFNSNSGISKRIIKTLNKIKKEEVIN